MPFRLHSLHLLLHTADLLEERLRQKLASLDLSLRPARAIDALHGMGKVSQATLERKFSVTHASKSTMTLRLIASGHVARSPSPIDTRGKMLRL